MTKEQRIELLKLARAAKAKKIADKKNQDIETPDELPVETPVEKVKKPRAPRKTLNLELNLNNEPEIKDEPEIIELTETVKVKKPKRKILRKIIKEEYETDDTEEEIEEVIYKAPKKPIKQKKSETTQPVKEQNVIHNDEPKKSSNLLMSFFNY